MGSNTKHIVIVGGGITGLTTAYYLQKQLIENEKDINMTLIEASHKLGGKIETSVMDDFLIEHGPDSLLDQASYAKDFISELKLDHQMISSKIGKPYVLLNNRLHPIPSNTVMGVPTKFIPFIQTDLISVQGKLRMCLDLFLPKSQQTADQSIGKLFRNRLGNEVVEHLVEPVFSSLFAGDIDHISVQATFEQFKNIKLEQRSLLLNMKQSIKNKYNSDANFITLAGGLQSLINEIEQHIKDVNVMTGVRALHINKKSQTNEYAIELNNHEVLYADHVIFTTPHHTLSHILPNELIAKKDLLHIPTTSVATVTMAFENKDIDHLFKGTGFVTMRNSNYTITGCTWTHRKWPHAVPKEKALLRCYIGRTNDDAVIDLSDDELETIVRSDLKEIIHLNQKPLFTVVHRSHKAKPHYLIGHCEKINEFRNHLRQKMPNVHISGMSYNGAHIAECIKQGKKTAQEVFDSL